MEFKGTKGKWMIGRIDEPTPDNDMTGYHTVVKENADGEAGMIDVWFSNSQIVKTKEEALYNALLICKAPEMLQLINAINNSLCGLLLGDNLTDEELRSASENLLPTIQSDCAKLIQSATELK